MAAGCVPVVPKIGGPWYDVLDQKQGLFGFSYESLIESVQLIKLLFDDRQLRSKVAARARQRALVFDSSVFEKGFLNVVEKAHSFIFA
jgi:hypothetical protein